MAGPWEAYASSSATAPGSDGPWSAYSRPASDEPPAVEAGRPVDDHGLSERQKLSVLGKALSPITSYPETYSRMNQESRDQMSRGAGQISNPSGAMDMAYGAGNIALGGLGYIASPINAAYRSIVGQPIEDTTGIPREYTEFAAQLATPGLGLPGAVKAPAPNMPRPAVAAIPEQNAVVAAGQRVSGVAPEAVNVPRAFSSDNVATQRVAQGIRNVPLVGDAIPRAIGNMTEQLDGAVGGIAKTYGDGSGPNVASRISRTIGEGAAAETNAASEAAAQGDAAVLAAWERAHATTLNDIAGRETTALNGVRQAVGDMSPQDMGATLIARLRQGEREAHATKERLYGIAGRSDGSIDANAVRGLRADVTRNLDEAGLIVDPTLTPAAARMVTELDNVSNLNIPNRVAPNVPNGEVAAVSMQGLEQARKRLNAMSQAATNDADSRAARRVIQGFDDWLGNSFDNALFSGSDEALNAYRSARAANTDWRTRFGFNARDDADRLVNRVVTGEVTPQEFSNWLVGSAKVGSKGVSSRLLNRVAEATGGDAEAMQAIRGGVWNRLSQSTAGVDAKAGNKVANDVQEFLNGSGRDVANRLFTPEQRGIMNTYANTLRRAEEARAAAGGIAANTKPSSAAPRVGPMQELANAVLGKGGKTDEALFNAINSYAKGGGRGDVQTLADLVRSIPEKDKGDLAGAVIRGLGQSKQVNGFSLEMFASDWAKYTPQAKTILFGNAGAHRQALDDIAMISQRYKDIGRRFGNPSGTAQNVAPFATVGSVFAAPFVAIPSLMGAAVAAKVLSSPAGASSVAKYGKAAMSAQVSPTPQRVVALQIASRNLANTANGLGANITGDQLLRALQSPSKIAAEPQQQ